MLLSRTQMIAYKIELRDTIGMALDHFDALKEAASETLQLQDFNRSTEDIIPSSFNLQRAAQTEVFVNLEGFLAAFARVSLLIFPVSEIEFAKRRARSMQKYLELDASSLISNRDLRDSWMHHDERLDDAVRKNEGSSGQTFCRSTSDIEKKTSTYLRVIELDTLVIHYRRRDGTRASAELHEVAGELKALTHEYRVFEDTGQEEARQAGRHTP